VSRVRNATEFLSRLRRTRANYEDRYRGVIAEARAEYSNNPSGKIQSEVDESLEHHLRQYFINGFLNALNWRLEITPDEGLPDLIPEAPIASLTRRSTRFLDYLGADRETRKPLLVVETKRPSSHFPRPSSRATRTKVSTSATICSRLADADPANPDADPANLGTDWNEWLDTLKDYVRSVHTGSGHVPRRVVITNGRWLVLFVDPEDSFIAGGSCSPDNVLVFKDADDDTKPPEIEERFEEVFRLLEHEHLLDRVPPLLASQLPFHLSSDLVDQLMHGLHVKYIEQKGIYDVSPVIQVSPIMFVRSRVGAWLHVKSQRTENIPHSEGKLPEHLSRVEGIASQLLQDVNAALRSAHVPTSLEDHYADEASFKSLPGVTEIVHEEGEHPSHELLIAVGSNTHYLLNEPTVSDCPYHDWARSREDGCEVSSAIDIPSVMPRSFFTSRGLHHCSHRLVAAAKAEEVDDSIRKDTGRSGRDGAAFCEIWPLDEFLCCRTCVFQGVCTKAEVFILPCRLPVPVEDNRRQPTI